MQSALVLHSQETPPPEQFGDTDMLILLGFLIVGIGWLSRSTQGRARYAGRLLRWVISRNASRWLIVIGVVMVFLGIAGH